MAGVLGLRVGAAWAAALWAVTASMANAAEITLENVKADDGGLVPVISVAGELFENDYLTFEEVAARSHGKAAVLLSSPGGNLIAGINIGRAIRELGHSTLVTDTCASACALAWLAGRIRFASEDARIGFHVAYVGQKSRAVSGTANAIVGLYLGELGYGQNVVQYVTTAPPDGMQWLSARDASLLGIEIKMLPGAEPERASAYPANPRPDSSEELEKAAVSWVRDLVETHGSSADIGTAIGAVLNSYAGTIAYYGKQTPLSEVIADKRAYFQRWPERGYKIREETIVVSCANEHCMVSGIYDWAVRSLQRGKQAQGKARFSYTISLGSDPRIVSESGEVIR